MRVVRWTLLGVWVAFSIICIQALIRGRRSVIVDVALPLLILVSGSVVLWLATRDSRNRSGRSKPTL